MPEVILPCPTNGCAGIGKIYHSPDQLYVTMLCVTCGLSTGYVINPEEAIARWNALPRAMSWTHEPPKVPGWYWCRASTLNMQRCVEVYGAWEQLMFGSKRDDFNPQMPVTREGFEWAGPIPEPLEPEES